MCVSFFDIQHTVGTLHTNINANDYFSIGIYSMKRR